MAASIKYSGGRLVLLLCALFLSQLTLSSPAMASYSLDPFPVKNILGHEDNLSRIEIIKQGKALVTASKDQFVKIWDTKTGHKLHSLVGHPDILTALSVSQDGTLIASGDYSGNIIIWNSVSGGMLLRIDPQGSVYNPVGKLLIKGENKPQARSTVGALCFNSTGDLLAIGRWNSTIEIWKLWDYSSLKNKIKTKKIQTIIDHSDGATDLAFSLDRDVLFAGNRDGTIKRWDLTKDHATILCKIRGKVTALAYSPNRRLIAASSSRKKIVVYDLAQKRVLWEKRTHEKAVNTLAFLDDGKTVASGGADKRFVISRAENGEYLYEKILANDVMTLSVDDSNHLVAMSSGINSGKEVSLFRWKRDHRGKPQKQHPVIDAKVSQPIIESGSKSKSTTGSKTVQKQKPSSISFYIPDYLESNQDKLDFTLNVDSNYQVQYLGLHNLSTGKNIRCRSQRGIKIEPGSGEGYLCSIVLGPGLNKIQAIAVDSTGFEKLSKVVIVQRKETGLPVTGWYAQQHALVVGISKYQDTDISYLPNAESDARAVADLLGKLGFKTHVLLGGDATKNNIINIFDELARNTGEQDSFVFYFAGHGQGVTTEHGATHGFIIPVDAQLSSAKLANYSLVAIELKILQDIASDLKAKHITLLLDSCFSGLALNSRSLPRALDQAHYQELLNRRGINILTAGDDQPVDDGLKHSPFTRSLLLGLGKRNIDMHDHDGLATFTEVASFVRNKVMEFTDGRQRPQFVVRGDDGELIFNLSEMTD